MNSQLTGVHAQQFFPFLTEAQPPTLAPLDRVAEFDAEIDAIRYSIDEAWRQNRTLTDAAIADQMGITKQVFSKMKQDKIALPKNKFLTFIETTRSYALVQFYAMRLGLVVKTQEQDRADRAELERLKRELADYETKYSRVVGRG